MTTQGPVVSTAAAPQMSEAAAIELLRTYNVVRGDPSGSLLLTERLTRAQAAALFVRSMGAEELAKALSDLVPFSDAKDHWAAGEITLAERLGLMRGDGNGTFRPNADITYAEVLTVLLRMVKKEPAGPWDRAVIAAAAADIGIMPDGVMPTSPAIRGKIFWSLATTLSTITLPSGKTLLQEKIDSTPPQITLDTIPSSTGDTSVTVGGVARDAVKVTVDGKTAALNSETGRFSVTVQLDVGINRIEVEATDLAGNDASATVQVDRRSPISRLEITGPGVLRTSSSVKLTVTAYDSQGKQVTAEGVQATVSGDVATFDVGTSALTTASKTGRGVLTLRTGNVSKTFSFEVATSSDKAASLSFSVINDGRAPSINKDITVKVQVLDSAGAPVADDYWRPVSLSSSGLAGVSIKPSTAQTQGGIATFTVSGSREGLAALTASSTNFDPTTTSIQFLSGTRIVLTANPTSLKPDGTSTTTIRATLQDESGRTIANSTASDIQVALTSTGTDGQLTDSVLTIRRGTSSSSGDDAAVLTGVHSGSMVISGTLLSAHTYSVQALSVPINGTLPGVKLQATVTGTRFTPNGTPAAVTIRVLDSQNRLVTTGSYAFQLEVSTSNKEPKVNGLPEGLLLTFTGSGYMPVNDGRPDSDPLNNELSVVGRTANGVANLQLSYDKSGTVTITPVPVVPADNAFNNTTSFGKASGSTGMAAEPVQAVFAGAVAGVKLTVDSTLGTDQPGGAVQGARTMKLRARVVDDSGSPVPGYTGTVALTRTTGSSVTSIATARQVAAVNGVAEFTIASTGSPGYDVYTASSGSFTSPPATVSVRNQASPAPTVVAIRGGRKDDPSPVTGYVAPDADFMEIQLEPMASLQSGEPTNWVSAKVYRKGESTAIFTNAVVDLNSALPVIRVPKASLQRAGRYSYEVTVNNGAADSGRSAESPLTQALNALYNNDYRMVSALYDAETGKLTIQTAGLTTSGSPDASSMTLYKDGGTELALATPLVSVISVSSSSMVLKLNDLATQVTPEAYNGPVYLKAEDGWFFSADGSLIARASASPITVKPMGNVTHAVLDEATRKLHLYGAGFSQGTVALDQIAVEDGKAAVRLRPGSDRVDSTTDSRITFLLTTDTLNAIRQLNGPSVYVTATVGWLRVSSGSTLYKSGAITGINHLVYVQIYATSTAYDKTKKQLIITGSGFTGATLAPDKLSFQAATSAATKWIPDANSAVTVESASTLRVQLSDADASAFEARFSGKTIFMNAESGWLVNASQRPAAPLPINSIVFTVPR